MDITNGSIQFALLVVAISRLTATTLNPACNAVNREALALLAEGRASEAEGHLSQFVSQIDGRADDKLCMGVTLSNLTAALARLGKFDIAEQSAKRSMSLLEETLGPNAPTLGAPLQLLAQIAATKGQFGNAANLLSRVESLLAPTDADLPITKGLRATLLVKAGKLVEAEAEYRRSIAEIELAGRGATLDIAPDLYNLAVLYLKEHRVPEALALLERSVRIAESFPQDAYTHVNILLGLAVAHGMHKDSEEAEDRFREAMNLLGSLLPTVRPGIGRNVYLGYSEFLRGEGRKREAKAVLKESYARFGPAPLTFVIDVNSLLANQ